MRTISSALSTVLYGQNIQKVADLVTLYDSAGSVLARVTTYDSNLTFASNTYTAGAVLSRGRRRQVLSTSLEIDTQSVTFAPQGLTIAGLTWQAAALARKFSGARVEIRRAYMATPGVIPGTGADGDAPIIFAGDVIQAQPTLTQLRLEVRSVVARLQQTVLPPRQYVAYCPYFFGGERCGVTVPSDARTVAAGTTAVSLVLNASSTYAMEGSWVVVGGEKRGVTSVSGATLKLSYPLPSVPANGTAVTVYAGCDRTYTRCNALGNAARFGGFKDMPRTEGNG